MALSKAEIDEFERSCLLPWSKAVEAVFKGGRAHPRMMGAGPQPGLYVTADRSNSAQYQYSFNVFIYWPDREVGQLLARSDRASVISRIHDRLADRVLAAAERRGCDVTGRSQAEAAVLDIELDDFDF